MSIKLKNDAGTFSTNLNQSNPTANVNIALPTTSGTMAKVEDKLVLGTAQTASGTTVDFTGIPSWAKRITVTFNGVSLSGNSSIILQLGGSGGIENTGYVSTSGITSGTATVSSTAGFALYMQSATASASGAVRILNINANSFVADGVCAIKSDSTCTVCGSKTLPSKLDRIRITTVNGTDTFDAGTINIMWE